MNILVMGSGAVGGYFGGRLAVAGHDVLFVARGRHAEAMRNAGLKVTSATAGDFTVTSPVVTDRPDGSFMADLVLFCVKGYSSEEAIGLIRPAVYDGTAILTLQNGIGSGEILNRAFGAGAVLLGAAYIEASLTGPGAIVEQGGACRIVFGEEDGSTTTKAVAVDAVLRGAGIETELADDVLAALWTKLVFICALSGMMCITREPMVRVLATPETIDLTRRVMREAASVARAKGIAVADDVEHVHMEFFRDHADLLSSSMHLDLERGNPLEVGVLNGAVSRAGREAGVPTPVNDFITACLTPYDRRAREARRRAADQRRA